MSICNNCNKQKAKYEDTHRGQEQALCEDCMGILELAWDRDETEFVDKYRDCNFCGGAEQWCESCNCYSCYECDPYGTCQCN